MLGLGQVVLTVAGSVLLVCAALIGTASVIVHARVQWRRSEMGRHLMSYMAVIALVLDLGAVRFLAGGDAWWFALVRTLVFAGVPIVMGQRLRLQIKAQRGEREQRARAAVKPPPKV